MRASRVTIWETDPDEELRALAELLNAYGVRYVVFGSHAARGHGIDVRTEDVDLVPEPSADNLQRLCDALNAARVRWRVDGMPAGMPVTGRLEPRHFQADSTAVGLTTRLGDLDVVLQPKGFERGYPDLVEHAVTVIVRGVQVQVGALADLIHSKELLGRDKDLAQLPALLARQAELNARRAEPPD